MVWNSLWPDGSKSVKQNTTPGQQNTTYIENSMNNDHYWNIGVDEDGHHRSIQMKQFINSAIGAPADAPIATGMDGAMYLKAVAGTDPPSDGNQGEHSPISDPRTSTTGNVGPKT